MEEKVKTIASAPVITKKQAESYFQAVKGEFKKISWTKQGELRALTKVVVASTFLLGIGIYFVDLVVKSFLDGVQALARLLIGT